MKLHICFALLTLISLLFSCDKCQDCEGITIPDPAFKEALLEAGVDSNGDGQISSDEAEAVLSLDLGASSIRDLSGLEHFVNLDSLSVHLNPLVSLNTEGNMALRYLDCRGCELELLETGGSPLLEYLDCSGDHAMDNYLTELDLSGNEGLRYLDCRGNVLDSLELKAPVQLETLYCDWNGLSVLDASSLPNLRELSCKSNQLREVQLPGLASLEKLLTCGNRLTYLDVSSHPGLTLLGIDNMSMLKEVCVWTLPFPPEGLRVLMGYSPNVAFTTACL